MLKRMSASSSTTRTLKADFWGASRSVRPCRSEAARQTVQGWPVLVGVVFMKDRASSMVAYDHQTIGPPSLQACLPAQCRGWSSDDRRGEALPFWSAKIRGPNMDETCPDRILTLSFRSRPASMSQELAANTWLCVASARDGVLLGGRNQRQHGPHG
jgi:hypothetical protein